MGSEMGDLLEWLALPMLIIKALFLLRILWLIFRRKPGKWKDLFRELTGQ